MKHTVTALAIVALLSFIPAITDFVLHSHSETALAFLVLGITATGIALGVLLSEWVSDRKKEDRLKNFVA